MDAQFRVVPAFGPWGEPGDAWAHGVASRGDDGRLELYRAGPHAPPVTVPAPGAIVLTTAARARVDAAAAGLEYRAVTLVNVVAAPSFDLLPRDEPEDHLFDGAHDPAAAAALAPLWELVLPGDGVVAGPVADALRAAADEWVSFEPA